MHPNEQFLRTLFERLNAHDASGVAACYDEQASFQDIAFRLNNKKGSSRFLVGGFGGILQRRQARG